MVRRYVLALLCTTLAGLATYAIEDLVGLSPFPLFYLAVLVSSMIGGTGPGFTALALSALVVDLFLLHPRGHLSHSPRDLMGLALFAVVGISIVLLTRAMRRSSLRLRRALAEIEEKQALLQVTLAQMPTGVVIARAPSGQIVLANEQVRRILRLPPDRSGAASEGKRLDIRGADGAPLRLEEWPIYRALWGGETIVDEEMTLTRGDGSRARLVVNASPIRDATGVVVAGVGSFYDVTERRSVEETIERSEKLLRAVLDALPVGVWITDENGVITMGNPAGQSVWGGARYVGPKDYGQYKGWWPETGRRIAPEEWALSRAVLKGERALGEVVEIEAFDGTRKFMLNSAVPILGEDGRIQGAIVVNQDVTRLKEAEREVRRLNADLERRVEERTYELKSALDELEEFAYTVAHDLRGPLRAMSGLSTLLSEDYADRPLDEQGRDYARRIAEAARRMDALILDLLAYSRTSREEITRERVPLDPLVSDVMDEMSPELKARAADVRVEPSGLAVEAHSVLLRQVVRNLLSNAVKFMPAEAQPRVLIRAEPRDGRVRLWVEDNGIGIAAEHRQRIFGVFQRLHTQEAYPGTGIGLSIVRRATERMGGQVGVESELGRGSRFWIELPKGGPTS